MGGVVTISALLLVQAVVSAESPELPILLRMEHAEGLSAQQALARAEHAQATRDTVLKRWLHLPNLARLAFVAGDVAKAKAYAEQAFAESAQIRQPTIRVDAVYSCHQVLGRVLLQEGDVAGARFHLAASGKTTGTPVERSFGPNMLLARELLEAGERQADCRVFWELGGPRLDAWEAAIRAGKVPDFGGALAL